MDAKLTLKLDEKVIKKAKDYAQKQGTSLSRLIEAYLDYLTGGNSKERFEPTALVKSISGVLDTSVAKEPKAAYKKHLKKKYSR